VPTPTANDPLALLQLVSRLLGAGSSAGLIWAVLPASTQQAVLDFIAGGVAQETRFTPALPIGLNGAIAPGVGCKVVGYTLTYRTRLLGIMLWRFQAAVYFCYAAGKITYASDPIVGGTAHWAWEYKGLSAPIAKIGGAGYAAYSVYLQGHFAACPAWVIPCLKTMDPWIRLEARGDGWASSTGHV
jgi:hypothetical protein